MSTKWLADLRVDTANDLQSMDVFDLYRQLKQHHSSVSRNLLYALIGDQENRDWRGPTKHPFGGIWSRWHCRDPAHYLVNRLRTPHLTISHNRLGASNAEPDAFVVGSARLLMTLRLLG